MTETAQNCAGFLSRHRRSSSFGGLRKALKNVHFFLAVAFLAGCGGSFSGTSGPERLRQLQDENARLEREVTALREESLRVPEPIRPICRPVNEEVRVDSRPHLEVVRLTPPSPEATDGDEEVSFEVPGSPGVPFAPEKANGHHTRPVLKVKGEHEAWVYHRPLAASERAFAAGAEGQELVEQTPLNATAPSR